jgi:RimJ/RimL family protein N-acetyltransferase
LLIGMYVRPSARGQGLGRSLLDAALRHATKRAGVQLVSLTVTEGNEPAIRLYEGAGFVAWGTQPLAIATPSGFKGKVHMSHRLADAGA